MPKVSVIIPIYNVEKYLRQCLDSVVNQTLTDIEIICVNNGASVVETNIINEYLEKDSKIKVINFNNNQGYGKAVNSGFDISKGEYVGIVESDDYIESKMFEDLYNKIKYFDADVIKSAFTSFDECSQNTYMNELNLPKDKLFTLSEYPILLSQHPSIWSCLYKREFLNDLQIRFVEREGTSWVDNPFQLKSLYLAKKIIFTDKSYYHYRINQNTSSSSLIDGILIPYNSILDMEDIILNYHITDSNILYQFSLRVESYIEIMLSKLSFSNRKVIYNSINEMFDIAKDYLSKDKKHKKLYKRYYKKSLCFYALHNQVKHFIKRIFEMKINKKEKYLRIFGKYINLKKGENS